MSRRTTAALTLAAAVVVAWGVRWGVRVLDERGCDHGGGDG